MINRILFITLSNIGDAVLTMPALDYLRENFPQAKVFCMAGPRSAELFTHNPFIEELVIFDKHAKLAEKISLFHKLRQKNFDMVVDLRNTFYGLFLPAKYKIYPWQKISGGLRHKRDIHLYKVKRLLKKIKSGGFSDVCETSLFIQPQDKLYIKNILLQNDISKADKVVVIAVGARSHIKRWPKQNFAHLVSGLIRELGVKVILAGDKTDLQIGEYVSSHCTGNVLDLSARTNLAQLSYLLKHASLLITNDSATMHLGSYLNLPVLAVFGATDETRYGPWSDNALVVKKDIFCRPCEKAQCRFQTLSCTALVKVEEVLREAKYMLGQVSPRLGSGQASVPSPRLGASKGQGDNYKRILIVRTDRIGDVLLSTPVIQALRESFPHAYIAMMVSPYAKEIVEGNPYLDEVIIYDKDGLHKSWYHSMRFSQNLKKKRFDLALVLHPINRVHLITFFAGIKRRVGYDRKLGFLLTNRIKHAKQLGEMHESEYNFALLRQIGIAPKGINLYMPIKSESQNWADELFRQHGIKNSDKLLAIHPGASCPSKIWPQERFAEVADKLATKHGFKILIVAGPKDLHLAKQVAEKIQSPTLNLAGMTSISELASVLKRCRLFISNDSGPVHIATAVGTPVISIFGRKQPGLGPKRWGPLGLKSKILHRDVGCIECLAHNCVKGFLCLKAISVDDVLSAAESLLEQ